MAGRLGVLLTGVGALAHFIALLGRGMAADPNRVPWGNMYEFTLSGTFVVVALFLATTRRWNLSWLGPIVVGFVLCVLLADVLWLYEPVAPLTEALESYWLVIHVVAAVIATGAFTLGAITSILYLLKVRSTKETGYLARLPEPAALDRISYRMHAFGFPVWTFGVLISGPIWAHQAWSSYWNWDPKEVWAFITWVRLRRLPPRPGDRRVARAQRGLPGPGRRRVAVVQLHRHQLLQHHQPALVRRGCRAGALSRPQGRDGACRGRAGSPGRRRDRPRAAVTPRPRRAGAAPA